MEKGTVTVSEVSENGSVPELLLENTGKEKVLVMDGEQLVGAKQNRILNTTVLIAASSKVVIPVSCVEQGRWHFTGERQMRDSIAPLYAKVRASKSRQVTYNLQSRRDYSSDQGAIWGDISSRLESEGISAPTHAMNDHYTSRMRELKAFQEDFSLGKFKTGGEGDHGRRSVHPLREDTGHGCLRQVRDPEETVGQAHQLLRHRGRKRRGRRRG